jgi:hypothetical protein
MSYGLMFWDNTSHSMCIFKLQIKAARIIVGAGNRDSCKTIFSSSKILPLPSQYIYSFVIFVIKIWNCL